MKFDELDLRMRLYETAADSCVLPEIFMVARLDGRSFTRLTKEVCQFESPFDERFRDLMVGTTEALMNCGFRVCYGYTESDEISLLFDRQEQLFGRKLRKYHSTLAGEASAVFSLQLGRVATFDCRISQLPTESLVVDYFRWRNEDAARNALNAYCYWTLRKAGADERTATRSLVGLSVGQKNELLFQHGINFNSVPTWQRRGIGFYWQTELRPALNHLTRESTVARRRKIVKQFDLPMRDEYSQLIEQQIRSR